MKQKLQKLSKQAKAFLPSALPQTDAEFTPWVESILELADMPNNDSFVQAIGTMVLHLGPTVDAKPKRFFVKSLRASVAKQSAYNRVDQIRQREKNAKTVQGSDTTLA